MASKSNITIKPRHFLRMMKRSMALDYPTRFDVFLKVVAREGITTMKKNMPSHTGEMKNSTKVKSRTRAGGGLDQRANIIIGPTVNYAEYVDKGTNPSAGRYVPELGRRVNTGMHPGIKATNFSVKTAQEMTSKIKHLYLKHVLMPFRHDWARRLNG